VKPTIVLIIGRFPISAKFYKIPRKYQNSVVKSKFHSSTQNSVIYGKLWALVNWNYQRIVYRSAFTASNAAILTAQWQLL